MADKTRTVFTTLPLTIDGSVQPAGTPLTLPEADAQTMVDEGRATDDAPDGEGKAPRGRRRAEPVADPAPADAASA